MTPSRRAEVGWSVAAVLTVLAAMGILLAIDYRYFWYGDTQAAYYGWWYHLGDLVRHGHWPPMVDPHAWRAGGLAAEGQWGGWSPLTVSIGLLATASSHVLWVTDCREGGLGGRRGPRHVPPRAVVRRTAGRGVRRRRRRPDGRHDPVPRPALVGCRRDDLGAAALGVVGAATHHEPRRQPASRTRARLPARLGRLRLRHHHADRRSAGLPLRLPPAPQTAPHSAGC